MIKTIEMILKALAKIKKNIAEKDPLGRAWDLRIASVYRIFHAFDVPRFRPEPANPQKILSELNDTISYVEQAPEMSANTYTPLSFDEDKDSSEETNKRMSYLYGLAWSQLSREEYFDAAGLLFKRLHNSNKDVSFLKGAVCLDIGTGIARYALAMIQLGAKKVVGIDFSRECLEEARRRLEGSIEGRHISLLHKDVYKLAKEMDGAFDFVCANGVIHHLPDPLEGLKVTARCTKKGGHAFIFVFSKNDSPWWPSIEVMRNLAAPVPIKYAHMILSFYQVPGTKIFNTLDYSYTPIQHKFEREQFEDTLYSVGFNEVQLLEGGVIHDSVLRCKLFESDLYLYGISEIRYLLRK